MASAISHLVRIVWNHKANVHIRSNISKQKCIRVVNIYTQATGSFLKEPVSMSNMYVPTWHYNYLLIREFLRR